MLNNCFSCSSFQWTRVLDMMKCQAKKALKGLVIFFIEVLSEVFHSIFIISFETYIPFHMAGLHPCRRP